MSAFWARAIRSSFMVVSPENTTEPSAVSKRYARAETAWPWVTATAVTLTTPSSKTTTGTRGLPGPRRDGDVDSPDGRARVRHASVKRHDVQMVGGAGQDVEDPGPSRRAPAAPGGWWSPGGRWHHRLAALRAAAARIRGPAVAGRYRPCGRPTGTGACRADHRCGRYGGG